MDEKLIKELTGHSGSKISLLKNDNGLFIRKEHNVERNYERLIVLNSLRLYVPDVIRKEGDILDMEYIPEIIEENGKKKKVMDEFGRVQYSQVPKTDKEGKVKWKIDSLDLEVFAKNVRKYGLWQEDLLTLKEAILAADVE